MEITNDDAHNKFIVSPHIVEKVTSRRPLIRGASREVVDPWKEFKSYAFSPEGPKSLCRDTGHFQFVMSAFNYYESEVN